jgi:hypothetical protein
MNMTAQELAQFAREAAEPHQVLTLALAHQLETYAALEDRVAELERDLTDAERRADGWREEAQAIQRQLDMVRG